MSKPVCKMDNKKSDSSWIQKKGAAFHNIFLILDKDLTRNEIYFEGQNYEL